MKPTLARWPSRLEMAPWAHRQVVLLAAVVGCLLSTVAAAAGPLDPPVGLQATSPTANRVDLTWTDASDAEHGFKIERAPDASGAPGTFQEIGFAPADATGYVDRAMPASGTYWYRVRAV